MTDAQIIVGLATIIVFGIGAQWIGRRAGFPSLLLLLPAGLLAGDVLDLVDPKELFGDTLFPLVTLLVALLLFQSGLQLRLSDLPRDARGPVLRLVGIGGTITFLGASLAVMTILGIGAELSFLVGAIIVVSGPTVVGPLLEVVRPRKPTGSVLNWEGTFLDPVGATLGVVVLNLVLASGRGGVHPLLQMSARLGLGILVGLIAAALMVLVMSRFLVTDNMEAAVALLFAVAAFAAAEVLLSEAGLFATVTLGFIVANQKFVATGRIRGFGETLEVLIIGTLFILLGALVQIDALREYAWKTVLLTAVLVVLVRPISVAIALIRTQLSGRDRVLIGGLDPRGIVAAATAAQFSATLSTAGTDSDFILPVVFGVILGTGIVYGLGAAPLANRLGVALHTSKGIGIVGDAPWLADLAQCLHECDVPVLLITSDRSGGPAGADGALPTISVSAPEDAITEALDDAGLSQVLISKEPGTMLTVVMAVLVERLGRRHLLRLPEPEVTGIDSRLATSATAHPFGKGITRADIDERIRSGATVRLLDEPGDGRHGTAQQGGDGSQNVFALAAVAPDGTVDLKVADRPRRPGDAIIALVGGSSGRGGTRHSGRSNRR